MTDVFDDIAERIVGRIVDDLADRAGLGHEWGLTDSDIRDDIVRHWEGIAADEMTK